MRWAIWATERAAGRSSSRTPSSKSRYASSRETGSITGVAAIKIARISRLTVLYLAMFGAMTTASGQSSRALNIGMAERGPYRRAM